MGKTDAWIASVMAGRGKDAIFTIFERRNQPTKMFTPFQLQVNNQLSYVLKDILREQKGKGALELTATLIKFLVGANLFDEAYEYLIGRRPTLDPIGILNNTVGDLTGYELPNLIELGRGRCAGGYTIISGGEKGIV